ncbi:hypothetical protein FDECE_15514 [Fusarium decemcellulare]|nr:hypothetical protein FDECE_15514 [Fusarium decemcellulare]
MPFKPRVIIYTSDRVTSSAGATYETGNPAVDALVHRTPGVLELADIMGQDVDGVGAADHDLSDIFDIAEQIHRDFSDPSVAGIVIIHPDETLAITAYLLGTLVKTRKPVVLVDATRRAARRGDPGYVRLVEAVRLACSGEVEESLMIVKDEDL